MHRMKRLYQSRWDELATLRTALQHNKKLDRRDKEQIDFALREEQDSITGILAKYDSLYGN